jgi:hypothetical protein
LLTNRNYEALHALFRSRGSSVSIVSDYGLDDRAIKVRSPAGAKDFSSSLCVQTGSGAHPASCTVDTGGPFPGAKRGLDVTLTTHPHLVSMSGMSRSYIPRPPSACVACSGPALLFAFDALFQSHNVCPSLTARDRFSYLYKTECKIIFLYNIIITCLGIRLQMRELSTEL